MGKDMAKKSCSPIQLVDQPPNLIFPLKSKIPLLKNVCNSVVSHDSPRTSLNLAGRRKYVQLRKCQEEI